MKSFGMGKFIFVLFIVTAFGIGALVWAGYRFAVTEFPEVEILKTSYPIVHYQGPKTPPKIQFSRTRPASWITLGQVSKLAVGAILVSEDWAFYQHKGYDPNQIKEALKEDLEAGTYVRGASTITQQVARNVFLDKDKNLWRKFKELWLAMQIEEKVGKRKILETYLNIAEWGEGVYGIKPAARLYFQKDPSELTAKEGAFLAMLLPSPVRYSQSFRRKHLTEYARDTMNSILDKMEQAHYLTDEEKVLAVAQSLSFEIQTTDAGKVEGGKLPSVGESIPENGQPVAPAPSVLPTGESEESTGLTPGSQEPSPQPEPEAKIE